MSEHDTRIRWTGRERDIVVKEYQSLCASNTVLPMLELLTAAQKGLPKERQRPPSYALRAWFNKELKSKLDAEGRRNVTAFTSASRQTDTRVVEGATTTAGTNGATKPSSWGSESDAQLLASVLRSALQAPLSADEIKSLTELGVEIVVGILNDPRVRQAARGLGAGTNDDPFMAPRTTFQTTGAPAAKLKLAGSETSTAAAPDTSARGGKMRVLIAGPVGSQLSEVREPYESQLEIESWSPDQGFEQLRTLVDSVDIVIGMPSMLTQAVQNTLRHYAKRYVRHTTGIAGLGGELGKLATGEAK